MALKHTSLLAFAALAVALVGCGDHVRSAAPAAASPQVEYATADPSGSYDFIPFDFSARPGKVTVELYNPSSTFGPHGIAIRGHDVHAVSPPAPRGGVTHVTATLGPGRYELYSPVDANAQKGMRGTLTIR